MSRIVRRAIIWNLNPGILWLAHVLCASSESPGFERTLAVALKDPVSIDIRVSKGDVTVRYGRDGQVSIRAEAKDASGNRLPKESFESTLVIEQAENHIFIRELPDLGEANSVDTISYKIDVPTRTEVNSTISGVGRQTVMGITGPATLVTIAGDVDASYVSPGPVKAETGKGTISCIRVAQVQATTGSGGITLVEDGPSVATVKRGLGRIEVGGARGSFNGSTDQGEIHVKAEPWDDWQLRSASGSIRIELPQRSKFEAVAVTRSGEIWVRRPGMDTPGVGIHHWRQKVNGGVKQIQLRTEAGNITIE